MYLFILLWGINFDGVKESFVLLWKRFSHSSSTLIDNIKAWIWLWWNQVNYSWENIWHMIKQSFNISYIDYHTFINIWLIVLFVIITILILMKWLWPVWWQLSGSNKKMEQKWWLSWIFSLFSVFLSKISKYIISFVFVILLTLLLTFISKKIIDNGDYWVNTDNKIEVINNTPLLFDHFYGNVNKITFKDDKYLIQRWKRFYWLTYINSKQSMDWKTFVDWISGSISPYDVVKKTSLNWWFNQSYQFINNAKWKEYFDIASIEKPLNKKYEMGTKDQPVSLRANLDNVWWFNIHFKLAPSWNVWNKETIWFNLSTKNNKILSEITNNKDLSLTNGRDTYIAVSLDIKNINTVDSDSFQILKASWNWKLTNTQISYIYKYVNFNNKNKLSSIYICKWITNDGTTVGNLNMTWSWSSQNWVCLNFPVEQYNRFIRIPFIIQQNRIIVNDYGSIISTSLLLSKLEKSRKNIWTIKDQIINNNIADLWIDSFPLQYSYKYKLWINTVSPNNTNADISLGGGKYQTNLLYKYTPSFILSLVYLEKITWKSALNTLPNGTELKKYYNKYFLFSEWGSIDQIYINKDNTTLSSYINLNANQVINLVGAEWSNWNQNVYKVWFSSDKNSINPLSIWIEPTDPLYIKAKTFYWWNLSDNKLLPEQINILMKSMLSDSIYYYYKFINPWIDSSYHSSYLATNKIYSYLYNFSWLVYKSLWVGIFKWILYLIFILMFWFFWVMALFKSVMSIWGKKSQQVKDKFWTTWKQLEKLSWSVSNSKGVQLIFIILWLTSFYLLYQRAITIFILASLIWIFLLWREWKGDQNKVAESQDSSSEDNSKVKQSLESKKTWDKIKWSIIALKWRWKDFLKKVVNWKNKSQTFLRNLWTILINIAANAYSFVLISIIVYLVITSLMIYFNWWQVLTFNKWFWVYPDIMFLLFIISWMAAMFSFQWRLSNIVSGFIINQISWQDSFFNNFLQSHLDKSSFNKVTMWQNNITDAVIKSMKVGLNKIEEQTENEKLKGALKKIKDMNKGVASHFDKWLEDKNKKMMLVSDLIEKWGLGNAVQIAKDVKTKINNNKLTKWSREKVAQIKQKSSVRLNLLGSENKNLTEDELEAILLNNLLDEEKKIELYKLMKSKWINDWVIDQFLTSIENKIKSGYHTKIEALPKTLDILFSDAKNWLKWKSIHKFDSDLFSLLDEEAKVFWLNIHSEGYMNFRDIAKKLYDKDMNISSLDEILGLFKDKDSFNQSLPFINEFIDSVIDTDELKKNLTPIFDKLWLDNKDRSNILNWIIKFKEIVDKNDIKDIQKIENNFIEMSWKRWPMSWLLYNQLYSWIQSQNIVKFKEEKNDIIKIIKRNIENKFPNGVSKEIDEIVKEMDKTTNLSKFNNLLNGLYWKDIIDDETLNNINNKWIQKYTKTFDNILSKVEQNDIQGMQTELWSLKEILNDIDPEKNKVFIDKINKFIKVTEWFDLKSFDWINHKTTWLLTNTLLSAKSWFINTINNTSLPEDKKNELTNLINNKLNNIVPSINDFYNGIINKDQLLWILTRTTDLIEEEFKQKGIDWTKLKSEANLMVDLIEKIKIKWTQNLDNNKARYESQAQQFVAMLYWNDSDILNNLAGGVLETIAWTYWETNIMVKLENNEKKIIGLDNLDINKNNIDLLSNTANQFASKKWVDLSQKIKDINKKISQKWITKDEEKALLDKKEKLKLLIEELKKEKEQMIQNQSEYELIEVKKRKLEMKKKNVKDKLILDKINEKMLLEDKEINNITNKLKVNIDNIANNVTKDNIISDKERIMKIKENINEKKLKDINKNIVPLIMEYKKQDISSENNLKADVEQMMNNILKGDEPAFLNKLMSIKEDYIDDEKQEEFIKQTLDSCNEFIYNKSLSHLVNSPYINDFIKMDLAEQWKMLSEIGNENDILLKIIDNWTIKYLIEDGKYKENSIDTIKLLANKDKILSKAGELIDEQIIDKVDVWTTDKKGSDKEIIESKKEIITKLENKVIEEEDKEKQSKFKKILDDTRTIFNISDKTVDSVIENLNEVKAVDMKISHNEKLKDKYQKEVKEKDEIKEKLRDKYKDQVKRKKTLDNEDYDDDNDDNDEKEDKEIKKDLSEIKSNYQKVKKEIEYKTEKITRIENQQNKDEKWKKKVMSSLWNIFDRLTWSSNPNKDILNKTNKNPLLNSNKAINIDRTIKIKTKVSDNLNKSTKI